MEVDNSLISQNSENKPMCLLVIGMAGSGKTSFVKALQEYLNVCDKPTYTINLDPAVHFLPYSPNIDIRDSINYKEVMKNYNLGPNGAILTSLNLFSTEMKELVTLIDNNSGKTNHVIIDTPGQIEMFKWSASGKIITQTLASSFPTAIVYIIDCSRCISPKTFMSNMLYATGVAIENELPFVMAMNKTDIVDSAYLDKWMSDVDLFIDEMDSHDLGYTTSITRQMALILDDFYVDLKRCGVSSYTGEGLKNFHDLLKSARVEYFDVYAKEVLGQTPEAVDLNESVFISQFDDGNDNEEEEEEAEEEESMIGEEFLG